MKRMNLLDLPFDVLSLIMGYLSYDELARSRIVSRQFNEICQHLLNKGFKKLTREKEKLCRHIKNILKQREIRRGNHVLARLLICVEAQFLMLSLTYNKYIERNCCCFIPGKLLDEILRIMKLISTRQEQQLNQQEVLQEVRDLSSMAIEHFDENFADKYNAIIKDGLKERAVNEPPSSCPQGATANGGASCAASAPVFYQYQQ